MTVTRRLDAGSTARLFAILMAAALVLAVLPLAGTASADQHINGQVIEQDPDPDEELIASTRFRGEQRFATAALIGTHTWEQNDRAIIARHDEWPDALAGGYLAGVFGAPVLLVSQQNLQDDTLAALDDLGVSEVTLLGGTQAISADNESTLETEHEYEVDRIGGETRFETAAMIATESDEVGEIDGMRTAIVATGIEFADALAMGPMAYAGGFPILLTPSQSLHPATAQALVDLEIEHVLLAGGTRAVSAEVEEDIQETIEGDDDSTTRLSGETRVETAADAARFSLDVEELGFSTFEHGWARGNEFADALTIGPRLGELGGPLLLVPTPTLVDSGAGTNEEFAEEHACDTSRLDIAGGFAAISEDSEDTLRGWFACPGEAVQLTLEAGADSAEMGEWVSLTATVTTNLGTGVDDGEVTFDVAEAAPTDAGVEFREEEGEPEEPGPITVTTDEDGQATVEATSDVPAQVTFEATHERLDETVLGDTAEVSFLPPEGDFTYEIDLSSENETDEDTADLDPAVTGSASLFLNAEAGLVCWDIEVDETEHEIGSFEAFGAVNAHIHEGEAGVDGGVVVPLGQVDDETQTDRGCRVTDFDLSEIEDDPAGYYVNVHTDVFPAGIVRGQLPPVI